MIAPEQDDDSALRFPSLASLRVAHGDLLRRQRQDSAAAGLRPTIQGLVRRGQATGAVLDDADDRGEAQSILDYWATQLFRVDRTAVDATLDDFDPKLAPKLDDAACPYVGLDAFRQTTQGVFFGRQRAVADVLRRLASERFLAVVGASGSGKSSLVLAGVLPALQKGELPGSASWRLLPPLVPGSEPLVSLANAFTAGAAASATAAAALRANPSHILTLAGAGDTACVLTIDQFEEVFTLCDDEGVREALAAALVALVEAPGLRHTVLVTLRSDYESSVAKLGTLQALFESGQVRVGPLTAAELREAIVRPAELAGLKFEEGVVDALLRDILGEPAGLPLLQFTLLKLWQGRQHDRVTWESYRRLRGGRLALAHSADELYDSLIPEDQFTARRILLRMVRTSEGLEVTSSRVRRQDLYRGGEDPGRIDQVLARLAAARLVRLTAGQQAADDQVEVAHEALVRNWPRLVEWLQEEAAEIAVRRRLESLVEEWLRLGKRAGLLDPVQLTEAERWLDSASADLLGYHSELPALIEASRAALVEVAQRQEAARQRQLEQARRIADAERARAEAERRSTRRFRALTVIMAVLLLATIVLGAWALLAQRRLADNQLRLAEKQRQLMSNQARLQSAEAKVQRANADLARSRTEREAKAREDAEIARNVAEEQTRLKEDALEQLTAQKALLEKALEEQKTLRDNAVAEAANARAAERVASERDRQTREAIAKLMLQTQLTELARNAVVESRSVTLQQGVPTGPSEVLADLPELAKRLRPLRMGASVGSPRSGAGTGSICCFVKDVKTDSRYLLSSASVLGKELGTPILQPGSLDGGQVPDRVALLSRIGGGGSYDSGAIARLDKEVGIALEIPTIGRLKGLEREVKPGDPVRLVGRGSGIVAGRVIRVTGNEIVTTIVPKPGDAGGAVISEDEELLGLLSGSDGKQSFVLPIVPILKALGVELIRE